MSGGGGLKKSVINALLFQPVQVYLFGAALCFLKRTYDTQTTFNYWFGRCEFERRFMLKN